MKISTLFAVLACIGLGACGTARGGEYARADITKLPDGSRHATVKDADERFTISSATQTTYHCAPRCRPLNTGGGVSNGFAGFLGPVVGGIIASRAPVGDINVANSVAVKATSKSLSKAKSIGPGSSNVKVDVNNTAIGTGGTAINKNLGINN